jgi:hypothetical protein
MRRGGKTAEAIANAILISQLGESVGFYTTLAARDAIFGRIVGTIDLLGLEVGYIDHDNHVVSIGPNGGIIHVVAREPREHAAGWAYYDYANAQRQWAGEWHASLLSDFHIGHNHEHGIELKPAWHLENGEVTFDPAADNLSMTAVVQARVMSDNTEGVSLLASPSALSAWRFFSKLREYARKRDNWFTNSSTTNKGEGHE